MINNIKFYRTYNTSPYENIALEKYLLENVEDDECIFYLWQNRTTVVIGRNQNAWKECNTSKLEEDNIFLARRLSGGGAVYHDLGNLNFTFLVSADNYNLEKQLEVILLAVNKLGLNAEKSGRNDILINGYKFSGNAFYSAKGKSYHHGTIMLDVDKNSVAKYLNVSKKKLESKGIKSVISRVANLKDFREDIDITQLSDALVKSFSEVYGLPVQTISKDEIDFEEIEKSKKELESWDWKYGATIDFSYEFSDRFSWGEIDIQMEVKSGLIEDILIYSDSLDPHYIIKLAETLKGSRFLTKDILDSIDKVETTETTLQMAKDIKQLIEKQDL